MTPSRRGFSLLAALSLSLAVDAVTQCSCTVDTFKQILAGNAAASVNYVASVPQGGSFGDAATNLAFPTNATDLPALCAVSIHIVSSPTSSYNFGVFLPESWNGRIMTTGNGGLGGGINYPDMGKFSLYGFATVSTDTGHNSNAVDGTWALNQPEMIIDWGWRAMHGSVVTAKEIVNAFYGRSIEYSYYASCSTGGRQGIKELELYPDSFDGVVAGAPAWWFPRLPASTLKQGLYNYPVGKEGYISPSLFPAIVAEMIKQCDPQDGLVDGVINDPFSCNFDFNSLLCLPGQANSSCLTAAQISTARQFYSNFVDVNQTFIFPGVSLGVDPSLVLSAVSTLGSDYYQYWVLNQTEWDITNFDYADIQLAEEINPGQAAPSDFDLSSFKDRGGKLLQYHGLADNLIATKSSFVLYDNIYEKMAPQGVDLDDFYRLFMIPGMQHCSGSEMPAPWYIGGGSQAVTGATYSVPGYMDAKHDVILAMMEWVERGVAPDELIATKYWNDTVSEGVEVQRPLCVYPKQAKYIGGNPSVPSSWKCKSLY
ncbi:hypothetical protein SEUCBS140593_006161 [Sporothrix eucalyptigena]|uniref:Carboxylic ester hydrolase n=1 Tax=Sporothrix eucalyptigena TaxID=1812306 RepID=A0ABP0C3H8_9PEZI